MMPGGTWIRSRFQDMIFKEEEGRSAVCLLF